MNVWKVASLSVCLGLAPAAAWGADGPQFEAASVKVAPADARPPYTISGGPGTDDPGRFHASHINMVTLLTQAFGVSVDQITVPARLKDSTQSAYYAVDLAIPPGTTKEHYQKMMQNLLTDRFHLAYHRETRDFPGYELVVDKDGPKFKEVAPTPGAEPNPTMRIIMGGTLPAEFPELDGPQTISMSGGGITRTKYQERTIAEFVSNLGYRIGSSQGRGVLDGYLQPRVVDKTGLTGKYTFILEYRDAGPAMIAQRVKSQSADISGNSRLLEELAASEEGGGADIVSAIQKQLGLRLDKTKGVPLEAIIVDSVDKIPTEN